MSISINTIVDDFVSLNCSPTEKERQIVKDEYEQLRGILHGRIFQGGSYARFSAITPLNDLDIIWVIPEVPQTRLKNNSLKIDSTLLNLVNVLREKYQKEGRKVDITPHSHSVMIEFLDLESKFSLEGKFSIDIVPAYELNEKNEFGDPLYEIPEVGLMGQQQRKVFYESRDARTNIDWIKTDPRGYKEQARRSNKLSGSFRRATKLLKKWKLAWKYKKNLDGTGFILKSFHIEVAIQEIIRQNPNLTLQR